MPIVPESIPELTPRDELIYDLDTLISDGSSSPKDVASHKLATEILELVEARLKLIGSLR